VQTECNTDRFGFQPLATREVLGSFDGGDITSDAGALLLREVETKLRIVDRFAGCFTDHRAPNRIVHSVAELVGQRVYGLALGYEDLNDHDRLRHDPLLAVLVDKQDPTGQDRNRERDRGKALAGKSTLNRLELSPPRADKHSRYKKITADLGRIESLLSDFFIEAHPTPPKQISLDFDATDDPIHGDQLGRFFQGYYKEYCYRPLYVFCGEHLLCAQLRPADQDGAAGSVRKLAGLVERIRREWPDVQIIVRADSGFCRENLMCWCGSRSGRFGSRFPRVAPTGISLSRFLQTSAARRRLCCVADASRRPISCCNARLRRPSEARPCASGSPATESQRPDSPQASPAAHLCAQTSLSQPPSLRDARVILKRRNNSRNPTAGEKCGLAHGRHCVMENWPIDNEPLAWSPTGEEVAAMPLIPRNLGQEMTWIEYHNRLSLRFQ